MPKVSVLIITYNHARFIAQAIESALAQRTSFDYEIVIGDDCSTDGTREIVLDYARSHSDRIRTVLQKRNVGGCANGQATLAACNGEYIAHLEGDDYWTCDEKLEKQVALLESRPESAGCFARSTIVGPAGELIASDYFSYYDTHPSDKRTEDIVPFGISPANTMIFNRRILATAPHWYRHYPTHCGLDLVITLNGPYLFLNETVGAYRLHPNSDWSSKSLFRRLSSDLRYLKLLYDDSFMREKYGPAIRTHIQRSLDLMMNTSNWEEHFEAARYGFAFLAKRPWRGDLILMGMKSATRRVLTAARRRREFFSPTTPR